MANSSTFFAHSQGSAGEWESLRQHLTWVSELAAEHGRGFGAQEECRFAGLLHDLGKYGTRFQDRLKKRETHVDHWSAGAFEAALSGNNGVAAALAIQGHHIGLQRGDPGSLCALNITALRNSHPLGCKLSDDDHGAITKRAQADGFRWPRPAASCFDRTMLDTDPVGQMLAARMIFSALVDADFIATERHFAGVEASKQRREPLILDARAAQAALNSHLDRIISASTAGEHINAVRRALLESCRSAGAREQGFFALSAPTGSGKTLSMLAWALQHCLAHPHLARIIVVLPYLSIIDQTARAYREGLAGWLADETQERGILEHHSLAGWRTDGSSAADHDEQTLDADGPRFLAENWDAPIVITSTVQFFESLFSNRPAACRKLHRIANSVVLLDEVQTLPPSVILPTLGALSTLVQRFRCSIVLATATQPAFTHLSRQIRSLASAGYSAQAMAANDTVADARLKRTQVHWPARGESASWVKIAEQMDGWGQALCIVNLKRHAHALFDVLRQGSSEGLLHLSTLMCPAHRKCVLDDVRARLRDGRRCLLVATQCVEAGVDIDFPNVLRAFGPLDSIAQAAGRCNRNANQPMGDVWVFHPDEPGQLFPDRTYQQAAMATGELLLRHKGELDIENPLVFREYFQSLYDILQLETRNADLLDAIRAIDFVRVAELYKIVDEKGISVLTPWEPERYQELAAEVRNGRLTRSWIQRARNLAVNVFRPPAGTTDWTHYEPVPTGYGRVADDWYILTDPRDYDESSGLRLERGLTYLEG